MTIIEHPALAKTDERSPVKTEPAKDTRWRDSRSFPEVDSGLRDMRVAELYTRRVSVSEIATSLHMTTGQVTATLAKLSREWKARASIEYDARQAEELAAIDRLEREYWDAWERSKTEKTTKKIRAGTKGEVANQIEISEQVGNPVYLQGVMSCIEKRAKMFGLDAPEKHLVGVKAIHGSTEGTAIAQRLTQYERIIVGIANPASVASGTPALNGAGESVDSHGPASEASGVLDVPGTER